MKKNVMTNSTNSGKKTERTAARRLGTRHLGRATTILALMGGMLATLSGCGVILHHYPEPNVGWHSKNYSIVFGVLSQHNTHGDSWTIRYSSVYAGDPYGGKFALTPDSQLVGYLPGNTVEIYGHPEPKVRNKAGTGTLYKVTSIRLWLGKGRPNYLTR